MQRQITRNQLGYYAWIRYYYQAYFIRFSVVWLLPIWAPNVKVFVWATNVNFCVLKVSVWAVKVAVWALFSLNCPFGHYFFDTNSKK